MEDRTRRASTRQISLGLQQAEEACKAFVMLASLQRAPSTPELADAEATRLEGEARVHENNAKAAQALSNDAKQNAESVRRRKSEVERHLERLQALRDDYADLLAEAVTPVDAGVSPTLEEATLTARLKKLSDGLRQARADYRARSGRNARDRGGADRTKGARSHRRRCGADVMRPELDDKRLDEFERSVLSSTTTRIGAEVLWSILARVFPHRPFGPAERHLLLEALISLEARGSIMETVGPLACGFLK